MCRAGVNRVGAIPRAPGLSDRAAYWSGLAETISTVILERTWNEKRGAFAAAIDSDDLDASAWSCLNSV